MEKLIASPTALQAVKKIPRRVSLAAYFRAEEKALHKHEYHDGTVIAMAGAKLTHNRLATKVAKLMDNFVEEQNLDFIVSNSDTKIRIEALNKVVYPDAVVISAAVEYFDDREDTIMNPLIIVEVLSEGTKKFDTNDKFEMYRTIPTFEEYVLIHQNRQHISVFSKQPDATWTLRDYAGAQAVAILYALHECPLPLHRVYKGLAI